LKLAAPDALLEEGSLAGAAERLRLSAPAMSRTLGRIRRATGDEILVRTRHDDDPTPYAVSIRATIHSLVQQANEVLTPSPELDLAALERTFTLRWDDAVITAVGPGLLATVQPQAPGVRCNSCREERGRAGLPRGLDTSPSAAPAALQTTLNRLRIGCVGHRWSRSLRRSRCRS
jgi:DNA-binding transcriptional LysR family regulator